MKSVIVFLLHDPLEMSNLPTKTCTAEARMVIAVLKSFAISHYLRQTSRDADLS